MHGVNSVSFHRLKPADDMPLKRSVFVTLQDNLICSLFLSTNLTGF